MSSRNDVALDVAHVLDMVKQRSTCGHCSKAIPAGGVAVLAPKLGPFVLFHPACFTCHTCKELLGEATVSSLQSPVECRDLIICVSVDLTYCVYQDHLYCER